MKVQMTITVEVDAEAWQRIYGAGPEPAAIHADVYSYVANVINETPAVYAQALQLTSGVLHGRTDADGPPAEPPVGTEYYRGGMLIWTRLEDGWHCSRPPGKCRNCPCDWFEVWDIGGIRDDPAVTIELPPP